MCENALIAGELTKKQKKTYQAEGHMIVHRLDMDTSGLLVLALTKQAVQYFGDVFRDRRITKRYTALLRGRLASRPNSLRHTVADNGNDVTTWDGLIDLPIGPDIHHRPIQIPFPVRTHPHQSTPNIAIPPTNHSPQQHKLPQQQKNCDSDSMESGGKPAQTLWRVLSHHHKSHLCKCDCDACTSVTTAVVFSDSTTQTATTETPATNHLPSSTSPATSCHALCWVTLVELRPLTGRTHQLRVHCSHALGLGHPIVGDVWYGGVHQHIETGVSSNNNGTDNDNKHSEHKSSNDISMLPSQSQSQSQSVMWDQSRLMLHASCLGFVDLETQQHVEFRLPHSFGVF
eukprot:c10901_g1_i1.p1 GENE.c10901_g1_i1~~c10901_g1_i1.p1  ORF type:complete len:344 (-),score=79.63 c10901_g1_i1:576-1607(-)